VVEEWMREQEGRGCSCLRPEFTANKLAHHSACPLATNLAAGAHEERMFGAMRSHFALTVNSVVGGGTLWDWISSREFQQQLRRGWRWKLQQAESERSTRLVMRRRGPVTLG
jgi:hypothetical protein